MLGQNAADELDMLLLLDDDELLLLLLDDDEELDELLELLLLLKLLDDDEELLLDRLLELDELLDEELLLLDRLDDDELRLDELLEELLDDATNGLIKKPSVCQGSPAPPISKEAFAGCVPITGHGAVWKSIVASVPAVVRKLARSVQVIPELSERNWLVVTSSSIKTAQTISESATTVVCPLGPNTGSSVPEPFPACSVIVPLVAVPRSRWILPSLQKAASFV